MQCRKKSRNARKHARVPTATCGFNRLRAFRRAEACQTDQGRELFGGEDLKNQKKKQNSNAKYTLVCLPCKDRERKIVAVLDSLGALPCLSCHSSTWRHKTTCKFVQKTNLRVSEADLVWLRFREKHRDHPRVTELSYYKELGLLLP